MTRPRNGATTPNRLSEAAAVRSAVADKLRAHFENTSDHQG
jgi:hypothetical protein